MTSTLENCSSEQSKLTRAFHQGLHACGIESEAAVSRWIENLFFDCIASTRMNAFLEDVVGVFHRFNDVHTQMPNIMTSNQCVLPSIAMSVLHIPPFRLVEQTPRP